MITQTEPPDGAPPTPPTLLEVAVAVFNDAATTAPVMEDLARAARITKSSIYHHVKGKEERLTRGVNRALDALNASLNTLEEPPAPPQRPGPGGTGGVPRGEILVEELPYVTLLLRVRQHRDERAAHGPRPRSISAWPGSWSGRRRAGLRTDLDPRLASRLVFGMVNSVGEWYRPGHGGPPTRSPPR